jgi:Na+-translocating ferredoxin:NAD+ oxidoreductase RnfG subunit
MYFYTIGFIMIACIFMSFKIPKNIYKKVSKEINMVYETEDFTLNSVSIPSKMTNQLITKIDSSNLFQIIDNKIVKGYAFISKAPSKTDEFDYLVLFDNDFVIKKAKVLIYREDYGAEIGSKRWLKQFIGKKNGEDLKYERDIIAISGATISAYSMTIAINNLLKSVGELQQQKAI